MAVMEESAWRRQVRRYGLTAISTVLGLVIVYMAYDLAMNRVRQEVAAGIVLGIRTAVQDSTTRASLGPLAEEIAQGVIRSDAIENVGYKYMAKANAKVMYLAYMFNAFARDVHGKEFKPMALADQNQDGLASVYGADLKLDDFQFVPRGSVKPKTAEAPQEKEEEKSAEAPATPKKKSLTW